MEVLEKIKIMSVIVWLLAGIVVTSWYGYLLAQQSIVQRVRLGNQVGSLERQLGQTSQRLAACQAQAKARRPAVPK